MTIKQQLLDLEFVMHVLSTHYKYKLDNDRFIYVKIKKNNVVECFIKETDYNNIVFVTKQNITIKDVKDLIRLFS